jgi:hypothetical protein
MTDRIPVSRGQRQLLLIWTIGTGLVAALLLVQTLAKKYDENSARAWTWFVPCVAPPLSLLWGAYVYTLRKDQTSDTVDWFAFQISKWVSIAYLALLLGLLLVQPEIRWTPVQLFDVSHLFLGPAQAVVTWFLGAFCVSQRAHS